MQSRRPRSLSVMRRAGEEQLCIKLPRNQDVPDGGLEAVLSSSSGLNVLPSIDASSDVPESRFSTAWWVFVALAATLLPLMVFASFDFGVTWDEKARHHYGELIWDFLRGVLPRTSTYSDDGGQYYGGLFDTLCAAIEKHVPANRYVVRHALNATFGWIGVLYAGRLAARLFGQ